MNERVSCCCIVFWSMRSCQTVVKMEDGATSKPLPVWHHLSSDAFEKNRSLLEVSDCNWFPSIWFSYLRHWTVKPSLCGDYKCFCYFALQIFLFKWSYLSVFLLIISINSNVVLNIHRLVHIYILAHWNH